jgi:hypothetical protein
MREHGLVTEVTEQNQNPWTAFSAFWLHRAIDRVEDWSDDGRRLACEAMLRTLTDPLRLRAPTPPPDSPPGSI